MLAENQRSSVAIAIGDIDTARITPTNDAAMRSRKNLVTGTTAAMEASRRPKTESGENELGRRR